MNFVPNTKLENEKGGLDSDGIELCLLLRLKTKKDGIYLVYAVCKNAAQGATGK